MPSPLQEFFKGFINTFIPSICPICKEPVEEAQGFCRQCLKGFPRVGPPWCNRCGLPFPSSQVVEHCCKECMKTVRHFRIARSFGVYDGSFLEVLHDFKYSGKTALSVPLTRLIASCDMEFSLYDVIVPVPLYKKRLKERGFNQSLLLGKGLISLLKIANCKLKISLDPFSLKKIKPSMPQVGLRREERRRNVKGTFGVTEPLAIKGKRILLVDDVFTTGATANECSRVLKRAGAGFVDVLTLARVVE